MSVNIRIMQKGFFRRKKFIIDDLVKLSHLSFGVMDENCQLIPNQIGNHTILFIINIFKEELKYIFKIMIFV